MTSGDSTSDKREVSPTTELQPQQIPRLGFWPNLMASFKHIRIAVNDEGNKLRKSDPLTIWLVPASAVILLIVTLTPQGWLRCTTALVAYMSVIFYIMARIGIVRALNNRQTNLVWHLLLASFLGGILFAFTLLEFLRDVPGT